ncbi:hypothetical protein [Streptomyces sp. NPDC060243]|uniref:hypothetical protein n=1 Tax=Streptomyces sp. NPDC060243 TaxID=3347081 RepID=UPI003657491D
MSRRNLRPRLATASQTLKQTGHPDLADAIDEILTTDGWQALRVAVSGGPRGLFALRMPVSHKEALARLENAGEDVSAEANAGLQAYVDGTFHVTKPARAARGASAPKGNFYVRVAPDLLGEAREKGAEAGVLPMHVIIAWLRERFELPQEDETKAVRGKDRLVDLPERVRDELREKAAAAGQRVNDLVNEGIRAFVDGEFSPEFRTAPWTSTDRVKLKLNLDDALVDQAARAAVGREGQLGFMARPVQIGLAYALQKLNIQY